MAQPISNNCMMKNAVNFKTKFFIARSELKVDTLPPAKRGILTDGKNQKRINRPAEHGKATAHPATLYATHCEDQWAGIFTANPFHGHEPRRADQDHAMIQ